MVAQPKTIDIELESEVARLLEEADKTPLVLTRDGVRYRLEREDIGAYYDPEAARAGMRAAVGAWSEADAERIKEYIYRGREEGTRPIDRP